MAGACNRSIRKKLFTEGCNSNANSSRGDTQTGNELSTPISLGLPRIRLLASSEAFLWGGPPATHWTPYVPRPPVFPRSGLDQARLLLGRILDRFVFFWRCSAPSSFVPVQAATSAAQPLSSNKRFRRHNSVLNCALPISESKPRSCLLTRMMVSRSESRPLESSWWFLPRSDADLHAGRSELNSQMEERHNEQTSNS